MSGFVDDHCPTMKDGVLNCSFLRWSDCHGWHPSACLGHSLRSPNTLPYGWYLEVIYQNGCIQDLLPAKRSCRHQSIEMKSKCELSRSWVRAKRTTNRYLKLKTPTTKRAKCGEVHRDNLHFMGFAETHDYSQMRSPQRNILNIIKIKTDKQFPCRWCGKFVPRKTCEQEATKKWHDRLLNINKTNIGVQKTYREMTGQQYGSREMCPGCRTCIQLWMQKYGNTFEIEPRETELRRWKWTSCEMFVLVMEGASWEMDWTKKSLFGRGAGKSRICRTEYKRHHKSLRSCTGRHLSVKLFRVEHQLRTWQ